MNYAVLPSLSPDNAKDRTKSYLGEDIAERLGVYLIAGFHGPEADIRAVMEKGHDVIANVLRWVRYNADDFDNAQAVHELHEIRHAFAQIQRRDRGTA